MRFKDKTLSLPEAVDKISAGEWVLTKDVKNLFRNKHEGIIFFETDELMKYVKPCIRHGEKGMEAKANNEARMFVEWVAKQIGLVKP